jgi:hypothetical protein
MLNEHDFSLSCGTLATLTGERSYSRLNLIGDSFVLWAITCEKPFSSWMDAWNEFYTA